MYIILAVIYYISSAFGTTFIYAWYMYFALSNRLYKFFPICMFCNFCNILHCFMMSGCLICTAKKQHEFGQSQNLVPGLSSKWRFYKQKGNCDNKTLGRFSFDNNHFLNYNKLIGERVIIVSSLLLVKHIPKVT